MLRKAASRAYTQTNHIHNTPVVNRVKAKLTRRKGDTSTAWRRTTPEVPIRVESSRGPAFETASTRTWRGFFSVIKLMISKACSTIFIAFIFFPVLRPWNIRQLARRSTKGHYKLNKHFIFIPDPYGNASTDIFQQCEEDRWRSWEQQPDDPTKLTLLYSQLYLQSNFTNLNIIESPTLSYKGSYHKTNQFIKTNTYHFPKSLISPAAAMIWNTDGYLWNTQQQQTRFTLDFIILFQSYLFNSTPYILFISFHYLHFISISLLYSIQIIYDLIILSK